jgi:hypothetical protein
VCLLDHSLSFIHSQSLSFRFSVEIPCDTLVILETLRREFPQHEKFIKIRIPIILKSQVYSMLLDHTQVEKELVYSALSQQTIIKSQCTECVLVVILFLLRHQAMLQNEMKIRLFRILSSQEEYAILFVDDYKKAINFMKHSIPSESTSLLGNQQN